MYLANNADDTVYTHSGICWIRIHIYGYQCLFSPRALQNAFRVGVLLIIEEMHDDEQSSDRMCKVPRYVNVYLSQVTCVYTRSHTEERIVSDRTAPIDLLMRLCCIFFQLITCTFCVPDPSCSVTCKSNPQALQHAYKLRANTESHATIRITLHRMLNHNLTSAASTLHTTTI